ncbi:MAG: hypothetical protein EOP49_51320, partial [Sphingobacteriales bacterium]
SGTIPAEYPKGFNAFWMMKYEFSKQQYLDFLNTLDQTSANARNSIGATGSVPAMTVLQPERAAHSFSPINVLAWLDWAAMRPMTEFEYEKACRGGNNTPSPLEFAWGNTTIALISNGQDIGTTTEVWLSGNANYTGGQGIPYRCGALATASSDRTQSGGSFYGVMDLSGNVQEPTVWAGNEGRGYTGLHGDGVLSANSEANTADWPSATNNNNMIQRGGGFGDAPAQLQMSDRVYWPMNTIPASGYLGGRGVRTGE